MKYVIPFFLLFLATQSFGQEKKNKNVTREFAINEESVWHADLLGNLYVADKDLLIKYDTTGQQQYSQSIKSKGRIKAISSINTMRIILFSEEQQTITLTDNTLSEATKTYDLSEFEFGFVTHVAVSSQPNKFWIYDQSEAKLVLLDLSRTNQQQEIENVRGILNATDVLWMKEDNNKLYMFDSDHKLFVFDLYGSLIQSIEFPKASKIEVFRSEIFVLQNDSLSRYRQEDKTFENVELPISDIHDFQWTNYTFFVRSENKLVQIRNR